MERGAWWRATRRSRKRPAPPIAVLVGRVRSGTNVLRGLLDSHPELRAYGELLSPAGPDSAYVHLRRRARLHPDVVQPEPRTAEIERFMAIKAHQAAIERPAVRRVLFDVKVETLPHIHLAWESYDRFVAVEWFERNGWPVLRLRRPNHLRRWLSMRAAIESQEYHRPAGAAAPAPRLVTIGEHVDRLVPLFDHWQAQDDALTTALERLRILDVDYGGLFDADGAWSADLIGDLAAFLGVGREGFASRPSLTKVTPRAWEEAMTDPARVHDALTGTRWECLLHEPD